MTKKQDAPKKDQLDDAAEARREFLKKIGKGSATIPAAVLLLSATKLTAQTAPSGGSS